MHPHNELIKLIRELYNNPDGIITLHEPLFNGNEKKYLEECIDTTYVSSIGKFVDKFEDEIAKYTGAKRAVACVNGTSALHLALKLIGVEQGHAVITQPLTFVATANAISYCNALPIFLDVDLDTMGLSPKSLLSFLENQTYFDKHKNKSFHKSTNKPISACIPMHTFGYPVKIDEIIEICLSYNIPVIEDAAESLGSFYKGKHTGTFGKIGVLSFNGNKIITTGGGGMLLFQDEEIAKKAKHLSTQAKVPHTWEFVHDEIGYNYRMPNINAAIGVAQLENLKYILASKKQISHKYKNFFINTDITFFSEPENSEANNWLNCILLKDRNARDEFIQYTNNNNILTRPIWQLLNKLNIFNKCYTDELKNAQWLENRVVNLPSSAI